jgi:hypothetical protein
MDQLYTALAMKDGSGYEQANETLFFCHYLFWDSVHSDAVAIARSG